MLKHPYILALTAFLAWSVSAAEVTTTVKMPDLPAAVQKTIHSHVGKGHVLKVEKNVDHDEITYDVEFKKNNRDRSLTVANDGKLLEIEVFMGETPAAVQAAIKKQAGTTEIDSITKVFDEDGITYSVDQTKGGKTHTFSVDESGKLAEVEVPFNELPIAVQTAVQKAAAGHKLGEVTQTFEDSTTAYNVEIDPDGDTTSLSIDPTGKLLSHSAEVKMATIPEPIQNAIKALINKGQLISVTKTTEDNETTYEIDFKHGEKTESASITVESK